MNKIVCYTRSTKLSPSSNYRLLQYIPNLGNDIEAKPVSPESLYKYHANARSFIEKIVWYALYYSVIQLNVTRFLLINLKQKTPCIVIQRALSPKFILPWNKMLMKKVYSQCPKLIWDFDDEIFNSKEITKFESELLQRGSSHIIVTSDFLRSRLSLSAQKKVELMATTDGEFANENVEEMLSIRYVNYKERIELLWLATSPGLPHLYQIIEELDNAAKILQNECNKNLILHVVCNKPLNYNAKYLEINNVVWSREEAKRLIRCSHIGIMPLTYSTSSKGKGGFKIVQYMSAALPAVVSAIGFNTEIVEDCKTGYLVDDIENSHDWPKAIINLSKDWDEYKKFCLNAKKAYNNRFSYDDNLKMWREIIER